MTHALNGATSTRQRWLFSYRVDGDVRFISHHDTMRLFRRALARADLPVRFSEGFNPHPRISIPLPRPVGIASEAEVIVVELDRSVERDDALKRLAAQMPRGMNVLDAQPIDPSRRILPERVRYKLETEGVPTPEVRLLADRLLEAEVLEIRRHRPKDGRTVTLNIRPYLASLEVGEDGIEYTLLAEPGGTTAKPSEIAGLLGFDEASIHHRIRRLEIQWK